MLAESILCLSLAIYHEARGEPLAGQYAVAEVVLNRVDKGVGKDICTVVYQPHQFSWTRYKNKVVTDKSSWERSVNIATDVLSKKTNHSKGALFFNTKSIGVRWNKRPLTKIGDHVFY